MMKWRKKLDKKPVGLILQGGGARGAYQVGVLLAIAEILRDENVHQNPFQSITGISVGAINAAVLASEKDSFINAVTLLKEKWLKLSTEDVYDMGRYGLVSSLFNFKGEQDHKAALFNSTPLGHFLDREINFQQVANNATTQRINLNIHAYDYTQSKNITFSNSSSSNLPYVYSQKSISSDHIIASSSIPYVFKAKHIGDHILGDGGLHLTNPCKLLIEQGCRKILGISLDCDNKQHISEHLFTAIFPDAISIDFDRIRKKNQHIGLFTPIYRLNTLLLRPKTEDYQFDIVNDDLPVTFRLAQRILGTDKEEEDSILSFITFNKQYSEHLIKQGYENTIKQHDDIITFFFGSRF
jgi:NTE family protein